MSCMSCFFFFNDTATTEIYTLSLHDALPIFLANLFVGRFGYLRDELDIPWDREVRHPLRAILVELRDRKSTRLNSSHANISYAVFCLKKKQNTGSIGGERISRLQFG